MKLSLLDRVGKLSLERDQRAMRHWASSRHDLTGIPFIHHVPTTKHS